MSTGRHTEMDKLYHYILSGAASGRIGKEEAVQMVTMLRQVQADNEANRKDDIAIVGMSSRIAGTGSYEEFWDSIAAGLDLTGEFPAVRAAGIDDYLSAKVADSGWEVSYAPGAYMKDIASFDYGFFRITPKEAGLMDPSHRVFLQTAWEAIEDAGYGGHKLAGSQTGVYVGYSSSSSYHSMILDTKPEEASTALTGNIAAMLPARIAYLLDLKGPTLILDTACSSSIVAIHMACKALQNNDCETAIAGGIRINLLPLNNEGLKLGVEAADGCTRTFDSQAEGAGWGEGSAALVLKPLRRAERDGDHIYAVIKGSAINQDGASIGITAPNSAAQAEVMLKAWRDAGIHPDTLSYIEAHGTATRLGDPLEIEGLSKAFAKHTSKKQFCAISTVKTNVGHLYECAGIAGVIKAALSLKKRQIPASIHFNRPNGTIEFDQSPVYVNTRLREWTASEEHPRRCGVSAFGLSGTNGHLVLEEHIAEARAAQDEGWAPNLLVLSAKSAESLQALMRRYIQYVGLGDHPPLRDVCYTAGTGRGHYAYRAAIPFRDAAELVRKLERLLSADSAETHGEAWFGKHKVVSGNKQKLEDGELKESARLALTRQAADDVLQYARSGKKDVQALHAICDAYVRGADVNWEQFYQGEARRKAAVPSYVFDSQWCWLETGETHKPAGVDDPLLYAMEWRETPSSPALSVREDGGTVLVLKGPGKLNEEIVASLQNSDIQLVIVAELAEGAPCTRTDDGLYLIDGTQESYRQLIGTVMDGSLRRVIHAFACGQPDEIDTLEDLRQAQHDGGYSLFYLTKALAEAGNSVPIELVVLAQLTMEATGRETRINPAHAPLYGMCKAIAKELNHVTCTFLDVDESTTAHQVVTELNDASRPYAVAYREGRRYTEIFTELQSGQAETSRLDARENGVYLITGGLGGVGLAIASYLASQCRVQLILVNRTGLPPRETWPAASAEGSGRLERRIRMLQKLEAMGAGVSCVEADVASYDDMRRVMEDVKGTYGAIHGVVHCAGVSNDGPLAERGIETFDAIYSPKVYGTWVLDRLTRDQSMDFFILCSSVATMFTSFGQGDYAAANAFMDAYASYRSRRGDRTLSVNWTTWKDTGMAFESGHAFDTIFKTLPTGKALAGLQELLDSGASRALVGVINYEGAGAGLLARSGVACSDRITRRIAQQASKKRQRKAETTGHAQAADGFVLQGRADIAYTELEQGLALCCKLVFGLHEIDIYDNFFELGADSLVLAKLRAEIEARLFQTVSLSELFEHTSVFQLAERLATRAGGRASAIRNELPALQKAPVLEHYPVSYAQRRMFLASKLDPASTHANQYRVSVLQLEIEPARIEQAVRRMIERHEILRTAMFSVDGEIVQSVRDAASFELDYWEMTESEAAEKMREYKRPFRLDSPPLFRLGLIKVAQRKYYLLHDAHHIITDGISMELFMRELVQLYKGEALQQPLYQYKDYAHWQLACMEMEFMRQQGEYWMEVFQDRIPVLELPTDYPRSVSFAFESGMVARTVEADGLARMKEQANQSGATLYMMLLAAYSVLLAKYSAEEDLVIGTPVTGRPRPELDRMLGMFINLIPMRVRPAKDSPFADYLSSVRASALQAFDHQDYPLDELIHRLQVRRSSNRHPMFDTVFILQNVPVEEQEQSRTHEDYYNLTDYDLTLEATERDGALAFRLEFNSRLFSGQTAGRMMDDLLSILDSVAENPGIAIQDIELASERALQPAYEDLQLEEAPFNF